MIYVEVEGVAQGPFSAEQLSSLWRAGEIGAGARYGYRGMRGWADVSRFAPPPDKPRTGADEIVLTTAPTFARRPIETEIEIVTAECVLGVNLWKDFLAGVGDVVDGRSQSKQSELRRARQTCLAELRLEAYRVFGDGVVAVRLDYSEIAGSMLYLVASGTAVRLGPPPTDLSLPS